jgi:death on curing protein
VKWRWIDSSVLIAVHDEQLAEHGGAAGIRDLALLESALHRPRQVAAYRRRPDALAAAYAFGIAKNHPFVDGNKRVAYVALRLFLLLNGRDIAAPMAARVTAMEAVSGGDISEKQLAQWIRRHLVAAAKA